MQKKTKIFDFEIQDQDQFCFTCISIKSKVYNLSTRLEPKVAVRTRASTVVNDQETFLSTVYSRDSSRDTRESSN